MKSKSGPAASKRLLDNDGDTNMLFAKESVTITREKSTNGMTALKTTKTPEDLFRQTTGVSLRSINFEKN